MTDETDKAQLMLPVVEAATVLKTITKKEKENRNHQPGTMIGEEGWGV
jgi:hypothetical protein